MPRHSHEPRSYTVERVVTRRERRAHMGGSHVTEVTWMVVRDADHPRNRTVVTSGYGRKKDAERGARWHAMDDVDLGWCLDCGDHLVAGIRCITPTCVAERRRESMRDHDPERCGDS